VTLIPFCKDEGADGDRDFLQWDTVSLMSLLNVYVIVGYYASAEKNKHPEQRHKNKISKQVFDYYYVNKQLNKLQSYHSSALHWNLDQVEQLSEVAELTLKAYKKISNRTGVLLHSEDGIRKRIEIVKEDAGKFRNMSRQLARHAQIRETLTEQPKEKTLGKKDIITLKNLLGGMYYWTVDECFVVDGRVFIVEKKHSRNKLLPSQNDIKDAFIKLALFSNIKSLKYKDKDMPYYAATGLTSETVRGSLHSHMNDEKIDEFLSVNRVNEKNKQLLFSSIYEAKYNGFGLFIVNSEEAVDKQISILQELSS